MLTNSDFRHDRFSAMRREDLLPLASQENFFHDMQLNDLRTGSWVYAENLPPNYHMAPLFRYLSEMDLKGARCLDIGTYDGMTAFVMSELGAGEVHGTCQFDLPRFRIARAVQKYENVSYYPKSELSQIFSIFPKYHFDVVVVSAMMHHLPDPLHAILAARALLKPSGYFILESIVSDAATPTLSLNTVSENPVYGTPTLWVPSDTALQGMLALGCFEIESKTSLLGGRRGRETNYDRVTFLARAEKPENLTQATDKTRETHKAIKELGPLSFAEIAVQPEKQASARYRGSQGARTHNIWLDSVDVPLQPRWRDAEPAQDAIFRIARSSDFRELITREPDGEFKPEDIELLATRYPGETMPDGMRWGLKQTGNLFVLDHVRRWGLAKVVEVGPGFNFYFANHLPRYADYTALDSAGFYDPEMLSLMRKRLPRGRAVDGLLGQTKGLLEGGSFDACISVSVLEHIPPEQVAAACADMFRLLRPGGWAVHSLDLSATQCKPFGLRWKQALGNAGFLLGPTDDFDLDTGDWRKDPPIAEPLSIIMRFHTGFKKSVWTSGLSTRPDELCHTIFLAARKPPVEFGK